jgi:hypothetical protein
LPQEYFLVAVLFHDSVFQTTHPYPSGVRGEKGLPKNAQVKPPKGLGSPFGGIFSFRPFKPGVLILMPDLPEVHFFWVKK